MIDLSTRSFTDSGIRFGAPLVSVRTREGRVFSLEEGGTVKVSDLATGRPLFETRRPGVTTIAVTGPHTVLCGRAATGVLGISIVRIDTRTGKRHRFRRGGRHLFAPRRPGTRDRVLPRGGP